MAKTTILIVDDELIVRRVLGDALSRAGYRVELAASGAEALERLARAGIDLLLLDLQLGDIDGVKVMELARSQWPNLPIVMLTAHGSLPSAIAAVRCSASDYLLKPISIEKLRERVAAVLAKHSASQGRNEQLISMYDQMRSFLLSEGILQAPTAGETAVATGTSVYQSGPLRIDVQRHLVEMQNQLVDVTPSEFAILLELLEKPGAVVACSRLMRATNTAVADEEEARQLIRPHIVRLRRKLEADPQQPCYLLSVRGVGYRWSGDGVVS
jgi:DNA-binding response OmpR family regulator